MSPEPASGRARPPGAPQRRTLPHSVPWWVRPEQEIFFITVCCNQHGRKQLCQGPIAREIFNSVEFRNRATIWFTHLLVLMPDHLHALVSFPQEQSMRSIISNWKRYLGTKLKLDWQRDFFDDRLRRAESFAKKGDYIRANPVRARLVNQSEDWPYFWAPNINAEITTEVRRRSGGAPGGRALPILLAALAFLSVGCRQDMYNQPKAKPLSQGEFFKDGMNARPLPPNTIAQGDFRDETAFFTGLTHGNYVTQLPMKLTSELMTRGRERYDVYCAVCHGATGAGKGMIVQRGYPPPPSYHIDRLRQAPIGHFYDVITSGYGVMYSYAARVTPEDRWAIAAYIRALQLARNAKPTDLAPNEPLTLNLQP